MKNITIAAAILAGVFFNVIPNTAEEIAPAPAPVVETVQEFTAAEHSEEIAPRDEITVNVPEVAPVTAHEIIAAEEAADTPLEPIAPGSDILEPVTLEAEEPVEASSIGPFYTLEPCASDEIPAGYVPNCYWDASERGNGLGYDFIWWEGEVFYPEFGR